jgi:hypothetical protein
MAKDFCTYSINFLRQEKILRDHESDWRTEARLTQITARSADRACQPGSYADNSKKRVGA